VLESRRDGNRPVADLCSDKDCGCVGIFAVSLFERMVSTISEC